MPDHLNHPADDHKRKLDDFAASDVTRPSKALKTETAGGDTNESGDPYIQAMSDVHRAMQKAINLGEEKLNNLGLKYNAASASIQVNISTQYSNVASRLGVIASKIASNVNSGPIFQLPEEVIRQIFSNLDTESLFACQNTCKQWKQIFQCVAAKKWWKNQPSIHCTTSQLNSKWRRLSTLCPFPTSLSINLWQSQEDLRRMKGTPLWERMKNCDMIREFPTESLTSLTHRGNIRNADVLLWNALLRCRRLKALHWYSYGYFNGNDSVSTFSWGIKDSSRLANCRLEEFCFDVVMEAGRIDLTIDEAFVQMLSRVKRLHLVRGLGRSDVLRIMKAAQSHLEELEITNVHSRSDDNNLKRVNYRMETLRSISLQDTELRGVSIKAPQAENANFGHGKLFDITLITSCRDNLRTLFVEVKGINTKGSLGQVIFDMPQLEDLHLDFTRESKPKRYSFEEEVVIGSYQDYSAAALWLTLDKNDKDTVKSILPKLKNFKIIHDPMLDSERLSLFVERRSNAGLPQIESMDICLANNCSDNTDGLEALRQNLPGFQYQTFDQWKIKDTREWSLTTSLHTGFCNWDNVDICRRNLRCLRVNQNAKMKHELFDMPELEELTLDCGYDNKDKTASTLWSAVSADHVEKEGVSLRDILPSLKKLKVINDATLDEAIVMKFVELRERLGMLPIEEMTIHLSEECSSKVVQLESLSKTMFGFTYKRYQEWHTW